MKKLCLCAMILLCACNRPESVFTLSCGPWDVDAKIYDDKIVMDIVNIVSVAEPDAQIPADFLQTGGKQHIIADNYTIISDAPETGKTNLSYYKTLAGIDGSEHGRVGLWIVRDNQTGFTEIRSLNFDTDGGSVAYFCHINRLQHYK